MFLGNRKSPYIYYRCLGTDKYRHGGETICTNASVNGENLEASVWSDVRSLLKDPGRLRREFERRLDRPPNDSIDGPHLEQSITQLKRRMGRLLDAYENGWLEKADFEPRIQRVKERLAREQEALAQSNRDLSSRDELRLLVGHFETFAEQIIDGLEQLDFATKRKLLRLLIHRVEVRIVYKVQTHPFVTRPVNRGVLQHCLSFR
ncbi:MAG TPA: zinc ribbon domain-containing protein [Thermoguttaceae bacterium]|nr:zinc ribbon domain-containing protein [Thermoguttaceae bacterium]